MSLEDTHVHIHTHAFWLALLLRQNSKRQKIFPNYFKHPSCPRERVLFFRTGARWGGGVGRRGPRGPRVNRLARELSPGGAAAVQTHHSVPMSGTKTANSNVMRFCLHKAFHRGLGPPGWMACALTTQGCGGRGLGQRGVGSKERIEPLPPYSPPPPPKSYFLANVYGGFL